MLLGDCVIFYQEKNSCEDSYVYLHEASRVKSGHKYAARTVVEYRPKRQSVPRYSVEIKAYSPTDIPSLRQVLKVMQETSRLGDQVVVLACGSMIVCIDGIGREGVDGGDTICHFVDPHVYDDECLTLPPALAVPGKGGIGYYCMLQLMEDVLKPIYNDIVSARPGNGESAGVEDDESSIIALSEEIKASALDYVSPRFLAITKVLL